MNAEQKEHVRKYIAKYGLERMLLVLNQDCIRMSMDIFAFNNRTENEKIELEKHPERKPIDYASSGMEQSLGNLLGFAEIIRVALGDKYNVSERDIEAYKRRVFDIAKMKAEDK